MVSSVVASHDAPGPNPGPQACSTPTLAVLSADCRGEAAAVPAREANEGADGAGTGR